MRFIRIPFALTLFLVAFIWQAKAQTNIVIDKIIGKVDNHYILKSDLEASFAQYAGQANAPSKCQLLEGLFVNKLLLAKAEIDSVTIEDKDVDRELNGRMDEMIRRFGNEKNIIEAYGKSLEGLKSDLRVQVREQVLQRKMQQKLQEKVTITPKEVKKFFETIPKDSLPYLPTEVEVGHIVRLAKVTKEERNRLKERLLGYKKRVQNGEEFTKLAKEFSEDIGSGQQGGDLGWAKRGMMVAPFEAAAMSLNAGDMSDIVETDFGLHLIQVLEKRGQEYHARHILLRPDYNRLDVTDATKLLDSVRHLIMIDSLKFDKASKEYSEDKNSVDGGGMLLNPETRGTKMPLDETMETYLYMTLDSMKVGTLSKPVAYRTEDGKTGVRIIWYKKKYAPHFASIKDDYLRLANITLSRKKNLEIENWFMKAKNEVFIYVDDEYKDCNIFGDTPKQ
jgi:peptidyl-prolyl cis-trans isomerase SurA